MSKLLLEKLVAIIGVVAPIWVIVFTMGLYVSNQNSMKDTLVDIKEGQKEVLDELVAGKVNTATLAARVDSLEKQIK